MDSRTHVCMGQVRENSLDLQLAEHFSEETTSGAKNIRESINSLSVAAVVIAVVAFILAIVAVTLSVSMPSCSCDKSSGESPVQVSRLTESSYVFNTTANEALEQFQVDHITQSFHTFETNLTLAWSNFEERVNKTIRKYVTIATEKTNKTSSAFTIRTVGSKENCSNGTTGAIYLDPKDDQLIVCNGMNYKMLQLHSIPAAVDGESCLQLYNDGFSSSGVYTLSQKNGRKPYKTFCNMNGGWTLIMKINGNDSKLGFFDALWYNKETLNPDALEDEQSAKLASYWNLPFTELRLGMKNKETTNWITVPYKASSLYDVIAFGRYRELTLGRKVWKSLISGSSLQRYCNREGFNVDRPGDLLHGVRIGIVGNEQADCHSPDSRLGFGGTGVSCVGYHKAPVNTCGNIGGCKADNGNVNIPVIGYIMAR